MPRHMITVIGIVRGGVIVNMLTVVFGTGLKDSIRNVLLTVIGVAYLLAGF